MFFTVAVYLRGVGMYSIFHRKSELLLLKMLLKWQTQGWRFTIFRECMWLFASVLSVGFDSKVQSKLTFFFKSWWKFTSIIIETSWCIGWKKSWTESFSIQQSYFWLKFRRSEHGEFSMSMFCLKLKLSETNFFYLLEWTKTTRRTLKRRGPGPHKVLSTNLKQLLNGKYTEAYIAECENSVRSL